ncbi:MAG: hypothetical protein Q8R28_11060, partial [Dehalococcoidia bacterium]|nr:hypothetical protein [Dehalococcoidia bacterium]
ACTQTAQFGRYCRETKEIDVTRIGKLINRGEPTDLRMVNSPFGGNILTPGAANQDPLKDEVAQAIVEVGISFERLLSPQLWNGNPANNNVGGGYREFPGLTTLVGTGKIDALNGTSCPSLDSDVKDYAYQDVCSGSPSLVEVLSYLYRYVSKLARTTGMDPVDHRFVMREELFYELTSCWPCSYMTFRCFNATQDNHLSFENIDQGDALAMRDAMRNGRYLVVDGKQIPVILDDGITEDNATTDGNLNPGEFASDIYLLPFTARGIQTLYLEYYDYRAGLNQLASTPMDWSQDYLASDGGKFAWTKSRINYCWKLLATIEPRVLLRTPHLAGRVQNVKYVPLQHTRQPFPTDGYFVDGGRTSTTEVNYYSEWNRQS